MNVEEINVNIESIDGTKELIVRAGEAEPVVPFRKPVEVKGNLNTPLKYLLNPPMWFTNGEDSPLEYSCVKVNRDLGNIGLFVDEGSPWESRYFGSLNQHQLFLKFKINTGESFTAFELADLIKMNRSFFESNDKAMNLVSELRNFKAKVDKDLENFDDQRGNKRFLVSQAVDSNIPEAFKLNLPIFKGYDKVLFSVEIVINANDFSCTLISPEVMDYTNTHKNDLIDEQIKVISEIMPSLKIFEI